MAQTQTTVQLNDDLLEILDRIALRGGVSRSALIRELLREALRGDLDALIGEQIAGDTAAFLRVSPTTGVISGRAGTPPRRTFFAGSTPTSSLADRGHGEPRRYLSSRYEVVHRWYTATTLPTRHPRIQVTEDPELARALRAAAPHLPPGLSRSRQVRDLAVAGARHLSGAPQTERERRALLERLAESFDEPTTAGIDWDALREGKRRAWRAD